MNPDLAKERQHASQFPLEELTNWVYQGKENVEDVRQLRKKIESEPAFNKEDLVFLDRTQRYNKGIEMAMKLYQWVRDGEISERQFDGAYSVLAEFLPTGPHHSMFVFCMTHMTTDEQKKKWLPLLQQGIMWGAYAQTELGHGSNVQGLETIAVYHPSSDEFEIHTPTLAATKWWPGTLGKTANFAVVYARMIIHGKDHGVQPFLVQLRSLDNHQPLKGISVGDIGPKYAFSSVDNGFLKLDHVRIPRENLLMKFLVVEKGGDVTSGSDPKLLYAAMLKLRLLFVDGSAFALSVGTTISIRYSAVRRQFGESPTSREFQVLDYQTQQYRLFPYLAASYCFFASSHRTKQLFGEFQNSVMTGADRDMADKIQHLHGLSSALKVLTTSLSAQGLEACRLACGGHGYSQLSKLPEFYADILHFVTAEGENYLLSQQVARYLLKVLQQSQTGTTKTLPGYAQYLTSAEKIVSEKCSANSADDLLNPEIQLHMFAHRSARILASIATQLEQEVMNGVPSHTAWNNSLIEIYRTAQAHAYYVVIYNFMEAIHESKSPKLRNALKILCDLFVLHSVETHLGDFTEDGYLSATQSQLVRSTVRNLLPQIRENAVLYVDAFEHSDFTLNSSLGTFNGNIYENLYQRVHKEPLNKSQVVDSYSKYMKPLIQEGLKKAKL